MCENIIRKIIPINLIKIEKEFLTDVIKCLYFLRKLELKKEEIHGKNNRYNHILQPYTDIGIPRLITKTINKNFPIFWLLSSSICRLMLLRKKNIEIVGDGMIISDHTSKCFSKHYLGGETTQPMVLSGKVTLPDLTELIKITLIAVRLIKKNNLTNPEIFARFIYTYLICKVSFRENQCITAVVVNDDLMPNDLALLLAAEHMNIMSSVFRINDANGRIKPPFKPDLIYCMTEKQANEVAYLSKTIIVSKQKKVVNANRLICQKTLNVGIPLTSYYDLNMIFKVIVKLTSSVKLQYRFRPHPETEFKKIKHEFQTQRKLFKVAASLVQTGVTLDDFASQIDIVLCGNSSAGKDLLDHGIPVLYRSDLDLAEFDAHGWLKEGYFFNFCDNFELNTVSISEFFQKSHNN